MTASERGLGVRAGALAAASGIGLAAAPIALRDLGTSLGTTASASAAVVTAFGIGLAASSAVAGRFADAVGARRTLDLSCVVVVLATLVVVTTSTPWVLLLARVATGFGAGGLSIAAFVAVSATVAPARVARAQGLLTATSVAVLGSGPLIGGALVSAGGWRLALAAPLASLPVVLLLRRTIPEATSSEDAFDVPGALLAVAACALGATALQAHGLGVDASIAVALGLTASVAAAALVVRARRRPGSFLPRVVLDDPRVRVLAGLAASCFGSYVALNTVAPAQLAAATGWSAFAVGALLLPSAAAGAGTALAAGRTGRAGPREVLARLALAGAGGMLAAAAVPGAVGPLVGACLGTAAFAGAQVVLIAATSALVPASTLGGALGVMNFALLAGGALASGLLSSLLDPVGPAGALAILAVAPLSAAALGLRSVRADGHPPKRRQVVA